jgi:hypothetical protein
MFFYGNQLTLASIYERYKMKKLLAVWMLWIAGSTFAQSVTGEVVGTVIDFSTRGKIWNAIVMIQDNGNVYRSRTDMDGRFRIVSIPAGKYFLDVIFMGDTMSRIPVDVPLEAIYNTGVIEFEGKVFTLPETKVNPGIRLVQGELPLKELNSNDLKHNANKFDIKTLASSMSTDVRVADDGQLVFRGARKGDMIYVLDGIKCNEVFQVPSSSISKMMVYTGGLPAKFGDTLGGAIVVETKGYFELYRAWKSQQMD